MATQPVVNKFRNKAKGSYMGRTKPISVTKGLQERQGAGSDDGGGASSRAVW
jgi:hypothetical protein